MVFAAVLAITCVFGTLLATRRIFVEDESDDAGRLSSTCCRRCCWRSARSTGRYEADEVAFFLATWAIALVLYRRLEDAGRLQAGAPAAHDPPRMGPRRGRRPDGDDAPRSRRDPRRLRPGRCRGRPPPPRREEGRVGPRRGGPARSGVPRPAVDREQGAHGRVERERRHREARAQQPLHAGEREARRLALQRALRGAPEPRLPLRAHRGGAPQRARPDELVAQEPARLPLRAPRGSPASCRSPSARSSSSVGRGASRSCSGRR